MSRLTKKLDNGMYVAPSITDTYELKAKLGALEDIEEEIGCPLDVLWKIRNQEFIYVDGIGKCRVIAIHIEPRTITSIEYYNPITKDNRLKFVSDYREEFWLKEDRTE